MKLRRITHGFYESTDTVDADGKPYTVLADDTRHVKDYTGRWIVRDSRGRFVAEHFTLRDARGSL